MSKETREHISSLMDGEISREASRFLVRRLGDDDARLAPQPPLEQPVVHRGGGQEAGDGGLLRVLRGGEDVVDAEFEEVKDADKK